MLSLHEKMSLDSRNKEKHIRTQQKKERLYHGNKCFKSPGHNMGGKWEESGERGWERT
jgi:hypothetical protein